MNNHWYNEGKEILNQGRSKRQVEGNYKITSISIIKGSNKKQVSAKVIEQK